MLTVDEAHQTASRYWRPDRASSERHLCDLLGRSRAQHGWDGLGVTILSDMVYRPWSLEGQRIEQRNVLTPIPTMDVGLRGGSRRNWRERRERSRTSSAFPSTAELKTFYPGRPDFCPVAALRRAG